MRVTTILFFLFLISSCNQSTNTNTHSTNTENTSNNYNAHKSCYRPLVIAQSRVIQYFSGTVARAVMRNLATKENSKYSANFNTTNRQYIVNRIHKKEKYSDNKKNIEAFYDRMVNSSPRYLGKLFETEYNYCISRAGSTPKSQILRRCKLIIQMSGNLKNYLTALQYRNQIKKNDSYSLMLRRVEGARFSSGLKNKLRNAIQLAHNQNPELLWGAFEDGFAQCSIE